MSPEPTPPAAHLGIGTKLAYGFGSIAYGIKDNGFSTLLLLFYNQVIGLRADLVGLAIMIALVLDAFIDPVIGHLSDHTRSRWGRRHPYMYAAAIPDWCVVPTALESAACQPGDHHSVSDRRRHPGAYRDLRLRSSLLRARARADAGLSRADLGDRLSLSVRMDRRHGDVVPDLRCAARAYPRLRLPASVSSIRAGITPMPSSRRSR